jgi:hypothetical protein
VKAAWTARSGPHDLKKEVEGAAAAATDGGMERSCPHPDGARSVAAAGAERRVGTDSAESRGSDGTAAATQVIQVTQRNGASATKTIPKNVLKNVPGSPG